MNAVENIWTCKAGGAVEAQAKKVSEFCDTSVRWQSKAGDISWFAAAHAAQSQEDCMTVHSACWASCTQPKQAA